MYVRFECLSLNRCLIIKDHKYFGDAFLSDVAINVETNRLKV